MRLGGPMETRGIDPAENESTGSASRCKAGDGRNVLFRSSSMRGGRSRAFPVWRRCGRALREGVARRDPGSVGLRHARPDSEGGHVAQPVGTGSVPAVRRSRRQRLRLGRHPCDACSLPWNHDAP